MKKRLLILLFLPAIAFGQTTDTLRNWKMFQNNDSIKILYRTDWNLGIIDTAICTTETLRTTSNKLATDNFLLRLIELWDRYKAECAKDTKVFGYRPIKEKSTEHLIIYEEIRIPKEEPTIDGFMEYIKQKIN